MAAASDGMEDIIKEFLVESAEGVDALDRDLVALECDPSSRELLAEIFRTVHTLKGNSGALGYPKLESVAHVGENVLTRLRDGELEMTGEIADGLLAMVDALRSLPGAIARGGSEGEIDCSLVVRLLRRLSEAATARKEAHEVEAWKGAADSSGHEPLGITGEITHNDAAEATSLQIEAPGRSIRVAVGLLDGLMNLVGELILVCNQVLHSASSFSDAGLARAAQRLKSVTGDLQESVMKARMQPIGSIWNQLPRLVRDLAAQSGKQVVVEMEGREIELDRSILEAIKDPLTHIVRNAVDHGIELPSERTQSGKTAAGHLRLRAFHEGGRVHVEISDDGAGVDLPRVRQPAVERGLITTEQAETMSKPDLARLVFSAGFSTAETVTNLSGRGIGMDVVRANIERIGGMADLQSASGRGTTVKINLPLTLAILPALMVSSGGERFAIPQAVVLELVRLELGEAGSPIEQICGTPVYRLHDRLLPLVFLARELHLPQPNAAATHVVVLQAGSRQFGLVVDMIGDTEEIVVKPLAEQLKALACFAGAAILGDGHVVLILDVAGVAQLANLSTSRMHRSREAPSEIETTSTQARQSWVTFRGAGGSRYALPMSAVVRLEEAPARNVERLPGREVVQYGGEIMPLLRLDKLLDEPGPECDLLQVLVVREADQSVGLVVDRIEDIVEETVELTSAGHRDLLRGTAVIQGRVADVLDLQGVLALTAGPVSPTVRSESW